MISIQSILDQLDSADGQGVTVVIVDSGVEASHPWLGGQLKASYQVAQRGKRKHEVVPMDPSDAFGHGTAAAGQIRRFAPRAELISLSVLDGTLHATSQALLAGLRWLADQTQHHLQVVNLSLSTQREQYALRMLHAVDELYARNITCVCARGYHLTGKAYPTCFAGTVAVTYEQMRLAHIRYRPLDLIELEAAGIEVEIAWREGQTRVADGSSYACPLVTGLAARLLSSRPGMTPYEVMTLLKAYAQRQEEGWWEPWMEAVSNGRPAAK